MSIQSEFEAAGQEYARRIEKQQQTDRLEALRLEARKHGNASAFAAALEDAFDQLDAANTDTQEH
ncbi:hypothetical protein [Nocardioides sp.]|uniref:hypothetical protein n=1 Tax=Nocardioides sp. TaxID=35761 RepID=UPI002BE9D939|nr:hypothetical protein [Nocardioides sp.]HXH78175.1 hypothetical protein [Nocardioides sp.]